MTKDEKNRIAQKIGQCFLRVVKNHNYYLLFKKTFFNNVAEGGNSYITSFSMGDVYGHTMKQYANHAEHEFEHHKREDSVYEYITIFINMIIRSYLEQGGVDPRKLGMIGQELFDLTCYGVFGDKYFTDMEAMNQTKGNMRAPRNDKEAWLMAEFEQRIRNGEQLDFEEFMRERTNVPDEEFWTRPSRNPLEEMLHNRYNNHDDYDDMDEDENDMWEDLDWDALENENEIRE